MVKIAFDIGGVLSKYPDLLRPIYLALQNAPDVDVYVLTDRMEHSKSLSLLRDNGFPCEAERLLCADYTQYGEKCKAVLLRDLAIDIMIDDYPAYVSSDCPLRLLVMPDTTRPYLAESWGEEATQKKSGNRVTLAPMIANKCQVELRSQEGYA